METILTILYLIVAICVALLTGFGAYALYHLALTARETRKTVRQANEEMVKIDGAVTAATEAVKSVSRTVQTAIDALNKPMDGVIRGVRIAQTIIQKFREMSEKHEAERKETPPADVND